MQDEQQTRIGNQGATHLDFVRRTVWCGMANAS